jgi:tetratricopeptide (TPR) repeat protein
MRRFPAFCIILLALANPANAATALDERPWIEVKTEHFVVRGVQSEKKLLDVARHAELLKAAAALLLNTAPSNSVMPATIYLVTDREYREIFGHENYAGRFATGPRGALVVIRDSAAVREDKALQFLIIAEQLQSQTTANYPLWYSRGLSDYFSGSEILVESLSVGAPEDYQTNWLRNRTWISTEEWLDSSSYGDLSEDGRYAFTAQSWLLVHYLHHAKDKPVSIGEGLQRFVASRQAGRSEIDSFETAFELDSNNLRQLLKRYMRRECCTYYRIPLQLLVPGFDYTLNSLGRAEASLGMGNVALIYGNPARAEQWLDIAINDPLTRARALGLAALAAEYDGRRQDAVDRFAEAPESILGDWEAARDFAILKLRQAQDAEGDEQAALVATAKDLLDHAVKAGATGSEIHSLIGRAFMLSGEHDKAIESLRRATQMLPSYMGYRLLLAHAYSKAGQEDEAYRLAQSLLYRTDITAEKQEAARTIMESIRQKHDEQSGAN